MLTTVHPDPLEHPITKPGALRFRLMPALEVLNEFSELSANGDVGMAVHGNYRSGKSTLMRSIIDRFREDPRMVVFYTFQESGSEKRGPQSARGMARLARQLRHSRNTMHVVAMSEVEAFCNVAQVEAEKAGTSRILVLIDEGQYLSDEQLTGLKGVVEVLITRGFAPFVILFGQPEMVALAECLRKEEGSLADRFFLRMVRMRGLELHEFASFLAHFDKTRWPEEGGPTYTQFWLPDFWGAGRRAEALSVHFERAFTTVCRECSRDAVDISVKYLAVAACRTLRVGATQLAKGKSFSQIIEESVRLSGIVESFKAGDMEATAEKSIRRSRKRQSA